MVDFSKYRKQKDTPIAAPHAPIQPMPTRRCVSDALMLISGHFKDPVEAASMGTSMERYWTADVWRAAVKAATVLHDAGVTQSRYMPKRAALRPDFRYFRIYATGEEFACIASQVDSEENAGFWPYAAEIKENTLTSDQIAAMERDCLEAEISKCDL